MLGANTLAYYNDSSITIIIITRTGRYSAIKLFLGIIYTNVVLTVMIFSSDFR
jgi:hypothetical protein